MARPDPIKHDSVTANLMLSVALFVGLMSFFIILNTFASDNHEKMALARQSLDSAFGFVGGGLARTDMDGEGKGSSGNMEEAASAALRSLLPDLGFESFASGEGQVMQVDIAREMWQSRWRGLRLRLADLMTYENPDGRYVLHIQALNGAEDARMVVAAAAQLESEGVKAAHIMVGYEDAGKDMIRLQFIERYDVQQTLTDGAGI